MSEPWRKHLATLGKHPGASPAPIPLFAPVIFRAAAQLEAADAQAMRTDATLLGKCLNGTRKLLGLDCLYVTVPSNAELEAVRADHPDAALEHPALAASIELCRRLSETEGDELALIAGLTGPSVLVKQLMQGEDVEDIEDYYEQVSACLLSLVKAFGEAGCNAIWFQEQSPPGDEYDESEIWEDSLTPIVNVAKFHKLPVLLSFTEREPDDWPEGVVACYSQAGGSGRTLPSDFECWNALPGDCQIVLTDGEIDPSTRLADLRERIASLAD